MALYSWKFGVKQTNIYLHNLLIWFQNFRFALYVENIWKCLYSTYMTSLIYLAGKKKRKSTEKDKKCRERDRRRNTHITHRRHVPCQSSDQRAAVKRAPPYTSIIKSYSQSHCSGYWQSPCASTWTPLRQTIINGGLAQVHWLGLLGLTKIELQNEDDGGKRGVVFGVEWLAS